MCYDYRQGHGEMNFVLLCMITHPRASFFFAFAADATAISLVFWPADVLYFAYYVLRIPQQFCASLRLLRYGKKKSQLRVSCGDCCGGGRVGR